MSITRVPLVLDASYYSAEWNAVRSEGVHLMQIIGRMEEERDEILGNKRKYDTTAEDLEAYRFGGFMFEHVIAQHIIDVECAREPEKLVRPGELFWCYVCKTAEFTADEQYWDCRTAGHTGIFATPDAIRTDTWRLKEWKFTWKSLRRAGGDQHYNDKLGELKPEFKDYENIRDGIWRWPVQTMAYCYLLDTTGADLEAFFVNGDYTNKRPKIMRYEMDFTEHELLENWTSIVNAAEAENWL